MTSPIRRTRATSIPVQVHSAITTTTPVQKVPWPAGKTCRNPVCTLHRKILSRPADTRKVHLQLHNCVTAPEKGVQHFRITVRATPLIQNPEVRIHGNIVPDKPDWIPRAVPSLMMCQSNSVNHLQKQRTRRFQNLFRDSETNLSSPVNRSVAVRAGSNAVNGLVVCSSTTTIARPDDISR